LAYDENVLPAIHFYYLVSHQDIKESESIKKLIIDKLNDFVKQKMEKD